MHHIDAKKERKTDRAARVSAVFYCALTVNQMSRHNLGCTATSPLLDSRLIHQRPAKTTFAAPVMLPTKV